MKKGDVIRVSIARKAGVGPEHYGVYDGNDGVYHFVGNNFYNAYIRHTSLEEFEDGGKAFVDSSYKKAFSLEEIIHRAQSKEGRKFGGYDLYSNNCEHFASWCVTGVRRSRQTGHYNREDDTRDLVETGIDKFADPCLIAGDNIDKFLKWGDYREDGEKSVSEEVFDAIFVRPLDILIDLFK